MRLPRFLDARRASRYASPDAIQPEEIPMNTGSILILPGDGIGPEVMAVVRRIISWYGDKRGLEFEVSEDLVGGAAYDVHGTPLADATMEKAQGGPFRQSPPGPVL